MKKQLILELDENLISDTTAIFDYYGLDIQIGIKMFLTRVAKDKNITFLFEQPNQPTDKIPNSEIYASENTALNNNDFKMTKTGAMRLFLNKGCNIARTITFSSKNRSANNYWANPNFDVLDNDWSLILNDNKKHLLHLFTIPAHSIAKFQLVPRADIPALIDLQIMYNDVTFTDNRSGYSFSKFFVESVKY